MVLVVENLYNILLRDLKLKTVKEMVRPARFELATYGFVVRRSIRAELRAHEIKP